MDENDLQDRRRANLRAWISNRGGVTNALAGRHDIPQSYPSFLSQLQSGYSFASRAARTCEERLGMPPLWLDTDHSAGQQTPYPRGSLTPQPLTVDEALTRIGIELARDLPDYTRDDLADEMSKWVRRKGAEHSRQRVAQLLHAQAGEACHRARETDRHAVSVAQVYSLPHRRARRDPPEGGAARGWVVALDGSWGLWGTETC